MAMPGSEKHAARLRRMRQGAPRAVAAALYRAGQMIELDAERSITAGSVSGKGHIPSAPGQPPNADTRDLDSKIDTVLVSQNPPTVKVTAYSGHAVPLEYGTSKMEARPFMRPAVARNRDDVARLVQEAVKITIK
jgi:HK97 gp10 family phage protein